VPRIYDPIASKNAAVSSDPISIDPAKPPATFSPRYGMKLHRRPIGV
jgi:hypothetical protein